MQNLSILSRIKNHVIGTPLVAQWIRLCLPVRGTRVQSLVWEDSTCRRATKAHAPQLLSPGAAAPEALGPVLGSERSHCTEKPGHNNREQPCSRQLEKPRAQQQRPSSTTQR